MRYFVSAIGTDSGKTLASAILVEALKADYWKPIQAGLPRDTDTVQALVTNTQSQFHPEAYLLQTPESPHAAAAKQGIAVDIKEIALPQTDNALIVEGAGGLMVPLNEKDFVIDLIAQLDMELILVVNFYLGSINHTVLSLCELSRRKIKIKGLILNGPINEDSKRIILQQTNAPVLLEIAQEPVLSKEVVAVYADRILAKLALISAH
jgi:dethiobiotin synthetase